MFEKIAEVGLIIYENGIFEEFDPEEEEEEE